MLSFFLVREVLQAYTKPLRNTISLEDIRRGDVNTQEDLVIFFLPTSDLTFNRWHTGRELTNSLVFKTNEWVPNTNISSRSNAQMMRESFLKNAIYVVYQ